MAATRPSAPTVLDRDFLPARAGLLALAAVLDRLDRAPGASDLDSDERLRQLREALDILTGPGPDRAARVQMIFSDPYEDGWLARAELRSR